MGFWDKLKGFFGGKSADGPEDADAAESAGDGAETSRGAASSRSSTTPAQLAERLAASAPSTTSAAAVRAVASEVLRVTTDEAMFSAGDIITTDHRARLAALKHLTEGGYVAALGYVKTGGVFHPSGSDAGSYRPGSSRPPPASPSATTGAVPRAAAAPTASAGAMSYRTAPSAAKKKLPDPYEATDILGLSPEETRRRSLKIRPYATAWIGRVDTIPPQSDERTALIDRGLILRGFLTEEQIREIHRVGDAWLKHHDALRLAKAKAAKSVDAFLEEERKKKEARKRERQELARQRAEQRERAVEKRRDEDIVFLGRGVSERLHDRRANIEELERQGLPVLATPADVAEALGLDVPELRWLCFHAEAPKRTHYVYFEVPKRSGGKRLLSSPHAKLRAAQSFVLEEVLSKLPLTSPAHGFVAKRSTVTNAAPHVGQSIVINLDLESFFPSITFPRVRGLFESVGYSPAVATILALLTTEPPRMRADLDGESLWLAAGERGLPQGAATSPALSNLVARKLDRRLAGIATKLGFAFTRYADDLTFSGGPEAREKVGYLFARVRHIVAEEGFAINEKKGRVQRKGGRQTVTGVVVNDRVSAPREEVRALRAILHQAKKAGSLEATNKTGRPHYRDHVLGRIGYVTMLDARRGAVLRAAFDALPR